jgi:hypothetical protein
MRMGILQQTPLNFRRSYGNTLKTYNFETTPRSSRKYTGTDRYREQLPKQNSKGSASKRNNEQMGLHQTKELLHSKGNSHQTQETAHRMGENLCQLLIQ